MLQKILFTVLAILTFSFIGSTTYAAPGQLEPPLNAGTAWYICQGYNNSISHYGNNTYALDFTAGLCGGNTAGQTVRAPAAGRIAFYDAPAGMLCVNMLDGRSLALTHINTSVRAGQNITAYQAVGTIAPNGQRANGGTAHLHLQMWASANCRGAAVTFESTYNAQICGFPNLTRTDPSPTLWNNGEWSGKRFIAARCDTTEIYRLYSKITKKHLFTADANEVLALRNSNAWLYEGVSYSAKARSSCQAGESVYRFYSPRLTTHLYTSDENERRSIQSNFPSSVWRYEGVAFCSYKTQEPGTVPVWRFYSEQLKSHLYTTNQRERDTIIGWNDPSVWRYEGVAYYAKH